ncbi:MAG: MFS transporter [Sphaerochaeta sp.]|jgi:MFS family permease|nr:MFS transporter [Sphaerochaeta sp.]MDX9914770.1 MFS transporter [Sphaerochaeta sp.]
MRFKYLLFVMVIVLALSSSLFGGLFEEIRAANSMTIEEMGQLMSIGQVGSLVSFLLLPVIGRVLSPHAMVVVGILGSSAALLGMASSTSRIVFSFFFLLSSLCGYLYGTSNPVLMVAADPAHMRRNIPLMHLIFSISAIASGWYITYLKEGVWYHGYLQMALLYLIMAVLIALQKTPADIQRYAKRVTRLRDSFSLLTDGRFLSYLLFLIIANSVEYTNVVYPLLSLSERFAAGPAEIGLAISIIHGGASVSRLVVIPLLRRGGRAKPILLALSLASVAALILFSRSPSLPFAYLSMALLGLGMGGANPVSQVLEISVWPGELLQLSNIRSMGSTVGRIIIPLALSAIIASVGLNAVFLFLASLMAVGTVSLLLFKAQPADR